MAKISTGGGLALGGRLPENRAAIGIIENYYNREGRRRAQQDAKALATMDDIKVDYNKWLPAYGKEAAKIQVEAINEYNRLLAENPRTAANKFQTYAVGAKQRIGSLEQSNDDAKYWAEQQRTGKFVEEPAAVKAITDPNSTFDSLPKELEGLSKRGFRFENGVFKAPLVEKVDLDVKFEAGDYDNIPVPKDQVPAEYMDAINKAPIPPLTTRGYSRKAVGTRGIDQKVNNLMLDPKVVAFEGYTMDDSLKSDDPVILEKNVRERIREKIAKNLPVGGYDFKDDPTPQPPQTTSETKVPAIIEEPSITEYHKVSKPSPKKNKDGTRSIEPSEESEPMTSLGGVSFSTPQTAVVTVSEYYDPKDQRMHKGTAGVRKINFQSIRAYNAANQEIKDAKLEGGVAKQKGAIWMDNFAETAKKNKKSSVQLYVPVLKSAVADGSGGDEGETVYVPLKNVESGLKLSPNDRALLNQIKNNLLVGGAQEDKPEKNKSINPKWKGAKSGTSKGQKVIWVGIDEYDPNGYYTSAQ